MQIPEVPIWPKTIQTLLGWFSEDLLYSMSSLNAYIQIKICIVYVEDIVITGDDHEGFKPLRTLISAVSGLRSFESFFWDSSGSVKIMEKWVKPNHL